MPINLSARTRSSCCLQLQIVDSDLDQLAAAQQRLTSDDQTRDLGSRADALSRASRPPGNSSMTLGATGKYWEQESTVMRRKAWDSSSECTAARSPTLRNRPERD